MEPYQQLEVNIGKWMGYPPENVVVCSSGTAALHLALEAMALPPGSEVIVPDFTMVACARAVTLAGLAPVFVDCNERLLMDPSLMRDAVTLRTGALMLVHVYGRRSGHGGPLGWPSHTGPMYIIEDLAEAHGIKPHPDTDAACWSFYKNKIVAGEEGGAIAFKDPNAAGLARCLRSLGFTEAHDFDHIPRGHNYRMSNLHAARILDMTTNRWGCIQEVDENLKWRREIEGWYEKWCPREWLLFPRDVVWVYDLRIPGMSLTRQDRVVNALRVEGIQARHGFKPMSAQAEFKGCKFGNGMRTLRGTNEDIHPHAYVAAREVIYLPVSPGCTAQESCRKAFEVIKSTLG